MCESGLRCGDPPFSKGPVCWDGDWDPATPAAVRRVVFRLNDGVRALQGRPSARWAN